jgi:hypothetical protein
LAREKLGRHVHEAPHGRLQHLPRRQLRAAVEVGELRCAAQKWAFRIATRRVKYVLGLDVPMDHSICMQVRKGVRERSHCGEPVPWILRPITELQAEAEALPLVTVAQQPDHVRMLRESSQHVCLMCQAPRHVGDVRLAGCTHEIDRLDGSHPPCSTVHRLHQSSVYALVRSYGKFSGFRIDL